MPYKVDFITRTFHMFTLQRSTSEFSMGKRGHHVLIVSTIQVFRYYLLGQLGENASTIYPSEEVLMNGSDGYNVRKTDNGQWTHLR